MPLRVKDLAEVQIGHAFRTGAATHSGQEAVLGVAMMLMGENSHAVAERVAEKVKRNSKATTRRRGNQPRIQQKKPGAPNDSHSRYESCRRCFARDSGVAVPPRQLARCSHRRSCDSAGLSLRSHRNDAIRHFWKSDESWRDRFWPDHRRCGSDGGKYRSTTWRSNSINSNAV